MSSPARYGLRVIHCWTNGSYRPREHNARRGGNCPRVVEEQMPPSRHRKSSTSDAYLTAPRTVPQQPSRLRAGDVHLLEDCATTTRSFSSALLLRKHSITRSARPMPQDP